MLMTQLQMLLLLLMLLPLIPIENVKMTSARSQMLATAGGYKVHDAKRKPNQTVLEVQNFFV